MEAGVSGEEASGSFHQLSLPELRLDPAAGVLAGMAQDTPSYSPTELVAQTQPGGSSWDLGRLSGYRKSLSLQSHVNN